MNEYWKVIKGFKSRYGRPYWVSSLGRFKNGYGKILSFHPHKKGYLLVQIPTPKNSGARWQAHRLVAKAFIPNPDELPQVNHLDCNKKNNLVSNLQWCTNSVNQAHAMKNGLKAKPMLGELNPAAKLTNVQAAEVRNTPIGNGVTRQMVADRFGVSIHVIKGIRSGKNYASA